MAPEILCVALFLLLCVSRGPLEMLSQMNDTPPCATQDQQSLLASPSGVRFLCLPSHGASWRLTGVAGTHHQKLVCDI